MFEIETVNVSPAENEIGESRETSIHPEAVGVSVDIGNRFVASFVFEESPVLPLQT